MPDGMSEERDRSRVTLREAQSDFRRRLVFSSGSSSIDTLLGGGLRTGEIVEAYGPSNSGKTQLAFQAAVLSAESGARVTFIDTEGTFRPERLAKIAESRGLDPQTILPRVFCRRATGVGEQISAVTALGADERIRETKLVIVDTVGKNFALEYGGQKGMLERQSILDVYLNRMARDAYLHDRSVLLTSRVASVGNEANRREVDIGGGTLRRFVHKVLHLERKGNEVVVSLVSEGDTPRSVRCNLTETGLC